MVSSILGTSRGVLPWMIKNLPNFIFFSQLYHFVSHWNCNLLYPASCACSGNRADDPKLFSVALISKEFSPQCNYCILQLKNTWSCFYNSITCQLIMLISFAQLVCLTKDTEILVNYSSKRSCSSNKMVWSSFILNQTNYATMMFQTLDFLLKRLVNEWSGE